MGAGCFFTPLAQSVRLDPCPTFKCVCRASWPLRSTPVFGTGRARVCNQGQSKAGQACTSVDQFPVTGCVLPAVIGGADFAIHVAGETGSFKSELAALHQQHFGAGMDRVHLPGAWSSTGNSIEALAFHAKDALLVIDDFAPHGNSTDVARYHAAADRVFRAAGNQAGRGRLDSTANLREPKPLAL